MWASKRKKVLGPKERAREMEQVVDVKSKSELQEILACCTDTIVLYFWCPASGTAHLDSFFTQLCIDTPHARFFRVKAEEQPEISAAYHVTSEPSFVLIKDGVVVDKVDGKNPSELANKVSKLTGPRTNSDAAAPASLGMAGGPALIEAVQQEAKFPEP